jgi:hypothetical protein
MTRMFLAAVLSLVAGSAFADVTIKSTSNSKAFGMSGTTASVAYIKGLKMRIEATMGGKDFTTIYDVDAQKMYILNAKKKQAEAWDMGAFSQELAKSVSVEGAHASLKPNGQTKSVGGQNADGYDIDIVVPANVAGSPMTIAMTGVSWIAKGAPGAAEYSAFYKGAAEKGWIFNDPNAAKAQPGQAKAMAEMYAQFAQIGGIPMGSQMDIKAQGEGMVAAAMARMGSASTTTTIDSVETGPLADELFQPPADYALKEQH